MYVVILFLITYAASIKLLLSNINMGNVFIYIKDFYSQNQIYMLMMAVCLFKVFNKIKIKYNFIINFVASSMFGVYLIHDVPLIRNILWQVLFKFENYYNSIILIPYSILVCLSVFCCCCFIEILRQKLIEKPFLNIIKKYS